MSWLSPEIILVISVGVGALLYMYFAERREHQKDAQKKQVEIEERIKRLEDERARDKN